MRMIFIRADGNSIIGMGHIMRCMSIATAFKEAGHNVLFLTADHNADSILEYNGFKYECLDSLWSDMSGELSEIKEKIATYRPELMIIDSYSVSSGYFDSLSGFVKTVYIDDLNEDCWNVDALINYNIYADPELYSNYSGSHTKLLLGLDYAPLRKEFSGCSVHEVKDVSKVLVLAGGADPECITESIMKTICPKFDNIEFHFIIGGLNPRKAEIDKMSEQYSNAALHYNVNNISELMIECDVAISAAGSTLYELCACGVPTIAYALADNQLQALDFFGKQRIMMIAGDCRNNNGFIPQIKECLMTMMNDELLRVESSKRMQALVDGDGAKRIVERLSLLYE